MASSSWSDFGAMSCSKRLTRSDFFSARLSRVPAKDIRIISCRQLFWQTAIAARLVVALSGPNNDSFRKKSGARNLSDAAFSKCDWRTFLEGEVHASADHAEVVVRPVHKIPAEVADPANVRREANFDAAADLANRPGFRTGLLCANHAVVHNHVGPLAAAENAAAPAEDVRRETRARYRVSQG